MSVGNACPAFGKVPRGLHVMFLEPEGRVVSMREEDK